MNRIMNRIEVFARAIVIGMLLVGPVVSYAATIALVGLGLENSRELTLFANQFIIGAIFGFVAALVCGAVRCRPRSSAIWSGVIALLVLGSITLWSISQAPMLLQLKYLRHLMVTVTVHPLATALMGYLIAVLTNLWMEKYPRSTDSADSTPSFAKTRSEPRTYHLK